MEVILIGGSQDGKRMWLSDAQILSDKPIMRTILSANGNLKREVYRPMKINVEGYIIRKVYKLQALSDREALASLIAGYKIDTCTSFEDS